MSVLYAVQYDGKSLSHREHLLRQRSLAEGLLEYALWQERGVRLSSLRRERTQDGKPYFPDCSIHFNVSHCRGLVCCALSSAPVGVDGEGPRPIREDLAPRICTEEELAWLACQPDRAAAFLSLWTLKESVMKLIGQGLKYGVKNAAFSFEDGIPHFRQRDVLMSQHLLPGGYVISVASRQERFSPPQMVSLSELGQKT